MLSMQERHKEILDMLGNKGEVRVSELSKLFEVSEVCIRNDLSELEGKGMLSRVHGGAISAYEPYYHMSLAQRSKTNKDEKEQIAAKIADMIHDNQSVMMNAGTTPLAVMHKLTGKQNITIITNSIVMALEGAKYRNFRMILLGGNVEYEYQFVYGALTLKQLEEYHADVFIMSADGIDAHAGVSTFYDQEAEICRKMIENSRSTIAALDYTKLGRVALKKFADIKDIDCLVTNREAGKTILSELKECELKIVLV